ncbi:hypothetical protein LEMLEM_LOCUS13698 [Lemmus lemmus]
MLRGTIRRPG